MPKKRASASELLFVDWLQRQLALMPPEVNLLALEWNDGWPSRAASQSGQPKSAMFSLVGIARKIDEPFDQEDPDHFDELSEPMWEPDESLALAKSLFTDLDPYDFVKSSLGAASDLHDVLSRVPLAYNQHDTDDVQVFRPRGAKKAVKGAATPFFYEVHEECRGNEIESYQLGGTRETPFLNHERAAVPPTSGLKLLLQKRPRLKDFLSFYRGWVVCSERATALLRKATPHLQVFPAPLWNEDQPVPGYNIVILYEKLNCLDDKYVLPPAYRGGPKTFDASRGYKIKLSVVGDRAIFRLNYEYFRLIVSQALRDRLEKEKITGLSWLRRGSEP